MLKHRSGTMLEDMYWINGATGGIVASALDEKEDGKILYNESLKKKLENASGLIAMHSHPQSMPPSIADFNSAFRQGYEKSIIICHDGTVYMYCSNQEINESLYIRYLSRFLADGYTEHEAQIKTLEKLRENHDIDFWEVK